MIVTYDKETDVEYIRLKDGVKSARTKKVTDWLLLDEDEGGEIISIEVLKASKNLFNINVIGGELNSISLGQVQQTQGSADGFGYGEFKPEPRPIFEVDNLLQYSLE